MTRTFPGPGHEPDNGPAPPRSARRSTWGERTIVLGGFGVAALHTAASAVLGAGMETVGALWLAAIVWTVPASLVLALRRGICRRDRSPFRRYELPDNGELIDWTTGTGAWLDVPIAEEHERLMRGD